MYIGACTDRQLTWCNKHLYKVLAEVLNARRQCGNKASKLRANNISEKKQFFSIYINFNKINIYLFLCLTLEFMKKIEVNLRTNIQYVISNFKLSALHSVKFKLH
jgi:hypothetical protein